MNKLKIYLRTNADIKEQAKTYAKAFNGKILKNSFLNKGDIKQNEVDDDIDSIYSFAYLQIASDINILIAHHRNNMPNYGYSGDYVINFKNQSQFYTIYENLKNSSHFKIDYDITEYDWGTKIVKFYDKWGYGWILETRA